jgi:uncharacterized membrane protein YczE
MSITYGRASPGDVTPTALPPAPHHIDGTSTVLQHHRWHLDQVADGIRPRRRDAWLRELVPGRLVIRRLASLYAGVVLFGVSVALMIAARLGLDPWDVFHQGLARRTGLPIGWVVNGTGVLVLLLWIPLRERPGIGTLSDAILVGFVIDAALPLLPRPGAMAVRVACLAAAVLLNAVATALYVGAGLGPGPRDGLMTGLARRGWPVRRVRTSIELSGLAAGWLLGGTVGVGTLLYAVSIGPLVHVLLPRLTITGPASQKGDRP